MPCCQGQDYDRMFDAKSAAKELRRYEKRGATGGTKRLLRALLKQLPDGTPFSHLDIGGGVGVLQHELSRKGAILTTAVDASVPYLNLLKRAATEHGYVDRHIRVAGDFTEIADTVEDASVVTLDKVICCYPDMPRLVTASIQHAQWLYGIVLPNDAGWIRFGSAIGNWFMRKILRWDFQSYVHPIAEVDRLAAEAGFNLKTVDAGTFWCVRVYERASHRDASARLCAT